MNNKTTREQKRIGFAIKTGLVVIALTIAVCSGVKIKEYKEEVRREQETKLAKEKKEQEERDNKAKIAVVLSKEEHQAELTALYEQYPQMEKLLLNREEYPDWLIEYLISHEEAVDWAVNYPDYMLMTEEERIAVAKEPLLEEEGEQNKIPMLFQWDSRWGYVTYGNGPIAIEGCGPTCLSMVVAGLTGDRSVTPEVVAEFAMNNGYYVKESGTSWSLMESGAKSFGLSSKQIKQWSSKSITNALKAGKVVICSVGKGDFTTQGHFIVIVGLNEDGTVTVNDPNNRENCKKKWEIRRILDQAKSLWEVGV